MVERLLTFGDELTDEDGNTVRIVRDDDPTSPREWDNGTHFYTYDGCSPDEVSVWDPYRREVGKGPLDMIGVLCEFIPYDKIWGDYERFYDDHEWDEPYPDEWMTEVARRGTDTEYIPELVRFVNEHGGWAKPIAIGECDGHRVFDANDQDGPYLGIIYMDRKGKEAVGTPDGLEFAALDGDVANQNNYESRNVFGFEVEDADGDTIWSLWGIYPDGDMPYIPESAIEWNTGDVA